MTTTYIVVFLSASLASFVLTRTVRNLADARGMGFSPTSERHIHNGSIPRLGGVAIFISFLIVAAGLVVWRRADPLALRTLQYILGPGALVFLLGLYDDFYPVKPYVKFAVQAIAATLLFFGGYGVFQLPLLFGSNTPGWLALPLTILWVLWITNAFNLLDGVDGLAAGSALLSSRW
jgi:UDP-GlcNAc:undecaprenyl-phosphate GlcNAc-1-phosphate transferase